MAVPVIITNIPGPIDGMIRNETGLVVEKKDARELTDAMKRIMTSDLSYLSHNALIFVKNEFEQQKFFARLLKDRKKLLGLRNEE